MIKCEICGREIEEDWQAYVVVKCSDVKLKFCYKHDYWDVAAKMEDKGAIENKHKFEDYDLEVRNSEDINREIKRTVRGKAWNRFD